MLKKLAFSGLMTIGFLAIALPAFGWGMERGISGLGAWVLVIVGGGLILLILEIVASAALEGVAAWTGSKLPEPIRRGLGKKLGGPLVLLAVLAILSAAFIALVASTT